MIRYSDIKFVPFKNISDLKEGDIIRHVNGTECLIITGVYGTFAIGTRTMHVSNPFEWDKAEKK